MTALHSCIVCVYKRMLKHGKQWWSAYLGDHMDETVHDVPVCERHEPEFRESIDATMSRGCELYPQGSDA